MTFHVPAALRRPPIRVSPLRPLLFPVPLLLLLTAVAFSLGTDLEVPLLFSRCRSHALLPAVSKAVPVLGPLCCFAISLWSAALDSVRGRATVAVLLALFAALLTVTYVEAARLSARRNPSLRMLWLVWLLLHAGGGPLVFQIFVVGACLVQMGREVRSVSEEKTAATGAGEPTSDAAGREGQAQAESEANPDVEGRLESRGPDGGSAEASVQRAKQNLLKRRHFVTDADVVAIPNSVLLGFALPAALMLIYRTPATIALWLAFPVWVPLLRLAFKHLARLARPAARGRSSSSSSSSSSRRDDPQSFDLESSRPALLLVYAVPVLLSVFAHVVWIWSLVAQHDDSRSVTRACVRFFLIEVAMLALSVLYWLFVEAGWLVTLGVVAHSIVLGPAAGVCIGWIWRERVVRRDHEEDVEIVFGRSQDEEADGQGVHEETPLLR